MMLEPIVVEVPRASKRSRRACGEKIVSACQVGKVVAVRCGAINFDLLERCREISREFFESNDERKRTGYVRGRGMGYLPQGTESLAASVRQDAPPDLKESFNVGRRDDDQPWPADGKEFREIMLETYTHLEGVGLDVLRVIASGLELPAEVFDEDMEGGMSVLRATYYPTISAAGHGGAKRAGPHTDYGTLSLLLLDPEVGGFEVEGESGWLQVQSVPNTLTLNIGDLLMRWTNGKLPATKHQVAMPTSNGLIPARISLVFLQNPNPDATIAPLEALVADDAPPIYRPVLTREYLKGKSRPTRRQQ